jgi:hypothetical protein
LDTNKINQWLILGANVGVPVGLVLVVLEINQANVTTSAEMLTSYQSRWFELDLSMQNAQFAQAWAKAMENPDKLTTSEMIQVGGLLWTFLDQISAHSRLWELSVFDDAVPSTEILIRGNASIFFGNAFAQSWWAEHRDTFSKDWVAVLDEVIEQTPTSNDLETFERIRQRLLN